MSGSILGFILGLLITLFTGYFAVSVIEREMELRFRLLFAIPLGFGINSILYFLFLCFNFNTFEYFKWFELAVAVVLALMYYNEEKPDLSKHKFRKLSNWFYLLNLYAVLIYLKYFINNPMGSWDGFRIWNIKAEFLFQNNPLWQNVFSLPHFMSHNDYPMMIPAVTARLWSYTGVENYAINATIGLFFTFGLVYLLYQALTYFKSEKVAIAVTSVFMILDIFLVNGAAQCADIPLAYMYLAAIVSLFLYFRKEKFSYIVLSLIFAALSAWTKNEGLLFFATPDILSGLCAWAFYDNNDADAVTTLFGSGCSTVVATAVRENRLKGKRTFIGLFDPSARPYVGPDELSFVIPASRFTSMYDTMRQSCLFGTHAWNKVKTRIEHT